MDTLKVDRKIIKNALAVESRRCQNKDGLDLYPGDVVVLDTANSSATNICVKTSNTSDDVDVYGVVAAHIANDGYGEIVIDGPVDNLRADGNTNISAGDELAVIDGSTYADYTTGTITVTNGSGAVVGSGTTFTAAMVGRYLYIDSATTKYRIATYTDATHITVTPVYNEATGAGVSYTITAKGRAMKATGGKGGAFATSLEAYTTNDCAGELSAVLFRAPRVDSSAASTLDAAYDGGGSGAGRAITVVDGAITMTKNDAGTENVLEVSASPSSSADGDAISITCGSNSTGVGIQFANSGSGNDIAGTSDSWTVSKAGAAVFTTLSSTPHTLLEGTNPAGTNCYIGRDNTGDVTINSLTAKQVHLAVAGTDVIDVGGAAITLAQATTISTGGLTVSAGGVTVSAGGATVTGNSTITGDLTVTGSLSFGGNWTVGATLTVDELILDTDGSAPAGTNCYLVQDNSGDVTLNCLTGKTINFAVNGTDEYAFGSASVDLNGNHLDNAGYLIVNEVTLPAATECYIGRDNTGDTTINALTSKEVHLAVAGTDIVDVGGGEVCINEGSGNVDFRVESNNIDPLFVCDGGVDSIGMGAAGDADKFLLVSHGARTITNNASFASVWVTPAATVTGQGTNPVVTSMYLKEPNITAGGATITTAATLYIEDAPTEGGTNNDAIRVAAGSVYFGGAGTINGAATLGNTCGITGLLTTSGGIANADQKLDFTTGYIEFGTTPSSAGDIRQENNTVIWAARNNANDGDVNGWKVNTADDYEAGADVNMAGSTVYGNTAANGNLILSSTTDATKGYIGIATGEEGIKVGGTADRAGAVGDNVVHIFDGAAAPAGALANGCSFYSEGGEMKVLDAAGNSTTLSPHTKDGDYMIHSFSALKESTVRIHLEKLVRALVEKDPSLKEFIEDFKGCV